MYQRTTETHALVRRLHRHLSQLPAGRRVRREHHASNDVTLVAGDEEHRIVIALDDQVRPRKTQGLSQYAKAQLQRLLPQWVAVIEKSEVAGHAASFKRIAKPLNSPS